MLGEIGEDQNPQTINSTEIAEDGGATDRAHSHPQVLLVGHEEVDSPKRNRRETPRHRTNSMDIARAVFRARSSGVSNPLDYSVSKSDSSSRSLSIPLQRQELSQSQLSQHCRRISTVAASREGSGHGELGGFSSSERGGNMSLQDRWVCWACAGRDVRDNEDDWNGTTSVQDKQLMRSEIVMGLLGISIATAAMVVLIALYCGLGAPHASFGPLGHVVLAVGSLLMLRRFNVQRFSTVRQNYFVFCWTVALSLMAAPVVPHILLGGSMHGCEAHSLLLTLLGPLLLLLCMPFRGSKGDVEDGQGALHRRLFSTALWSSPLFRRTPLRFALLLRSLLVVALVALSPWMPALPHEARAELQWIPPMLTSLLYSFLVTAAFRWLMLNFLEMKREVEAAVEQEELEKCKIEHLIHTLVPAFRAEALRTQPPGIWYRNPADLFSECSILQMDISGFTQLSTTICAEELIDVINAIFTSIDRLATAVGEVWKVETIGDCYVAVLGGPLSREEHGERAVLLGLHIMEIVQRISKKIQIELGVRIGIHSGEIAAAVVGCELPRYLIFGRDCEIVSQLEASAGKNCVLVSDAVQLSAGWQLSSCPDLALPDGTHVHRSAISGEAAANADKLKTLRRDRPRLHQFYRDFCSSVSLGELLPACSAPLQHDALQVSTWPLHFVTEHSSGSTVADLPSPAAVARPGSAAPVNPAEPEPLADPAGLGPPSPLNMRAMRKSMSEMRRSRSADMRKSISELVQQVGEVAAEDGWGGVGPQQKGGLGKVLGAESVEAILQSGGPLENRSPLQQRLLGQRARRSSAVASPVARGGKKEASSWHGAGGGGARALDWSSARRSVERFWSAHGRLDPTKTSPPLRPGKSPLIGGRLSPLPRAATRAGAAVVPMLQVGLELAMEELGPAAMAPEEEEVVELDRQPSSGESRSASSGQWTLAEEEDRIGGRRSVVAVFLLASAAYGLLLGALLAAAPHADFEGLRFPLRHQIAMAALPLAYALLALAMAASVLSSSRVSALQILLAALLLLISPLFLFGSLRGPLAPLAPLWGFLGVVLQCSSSGSEDAAWLRIAVAHAALVVAVNVARGMVVMDGAEEGWEVPVWMVVMVAVGELVPGTLAVLPLAVTVQELRDDQVRGKLHLYQHKLNKIREEALLNALLPPSIGARLRAEQDNAQLASRYDSVTVLFLYVDGCQELFLGREDPAPVIAWLNKVFEILDRILTRHYHRQVCKVETLHNVYLAVSGCPEPCANHARESVAVALEMIAAVSSVLRPDGRPTSVKVGLNSGSICGGVVGTENPRFSIYGDTVNTASRMASSARSSTKGAPYVHLSRSTALTLSQTSSRWLGSRSLALSVREEQLQIKGKGLMQTYYVAASRPYANQEELDEPPLYIPHTTGCPAQSLLPVGELDVDLEEPPPYPPHTTGTTQLLPSPLIIGEA